MKIDLKTAADMRIKECFDYLKVHELDLKDSQVAFVKSLRKQFRERGLSDRQTAVLFEMAKYLKTESRITMSI